MVMPNMAQPNLDKITEYHTGIMKELGADLESEGMKETPRRTGWFVGA
jgi:GTP cyclohydrolase I